MSAKAQLPLSGVGAEPRPEPPTRLGGVNAGSDRVLIVDDDPSVLDGYKRLLHGEIEVDTAVGAERGLATIQLFGPYAVVISDMIMPGMNGAEFLAQLRQLAPHTVRMLLTGHNDIGNAIDAVNQGNIFRYLAKPCGKEELTRALALGFAQYRANLEGVELVKEAKEIKLKAALISQFLCSRDKG